MWEPIRGDTRKRHLEIDGPTRLIRIREDANAGLQRLRGTRVSLTLVRGGKGSTSDAIVPPTWEAIRKYVEFVCQELPYRLNVEHVREGKTSSGCIDPKPLPVTFPYPYDDKAVRIPVADSAAGLEGEIAIVPYPTVRELDREKLKASAVEVLPDPEDDWSELVLSNSGRVIAGFPPWSHRSMLLRGGFNVGEVPRIPTGHSSHVGARVRMTWRASENQRYSTTDLARTGITNVETVGAKVLEAWVVYLLDNRARLPEGFMYALDETGRTDLSNEKWLERYSALAVYELARNAWHYRLADAEKKLDPVADWESRKAPAEHTGVYLYGRLLELVLPRIAPELSLTERGDVYVSPPMPDWREVLDKCHDFVSKPIRWSRFISFTGRIAGRLQHGRMTHRYFNTKYADRLREFSEGDLDLAARMFNQLLRDRNEKRPTGLDSAGATLLTRLIDVAGDLEISGLYGVARLDSFRQPK